MGDAPSNATIAHSLPSAQEGAPRQEADQAGLGAHASGADASGADASGAAGGEGGCSFFISLKAPLQTGLSERRPSKMRSNGQARESERAKKKKREDRFVSGLLLTWGKICKILK